jgi:hypothetical protein
MLRASFQLVAGLGPEREQHLWRAGLTDWAHWPATSTVTAPACPDRALVPRPLHAPLGTALERADRALAAGDLTTLARLLARREHWRLFGAFAHRAVFLDIETDPLEGITAIGLLDGEGPRLLLAGRDRHRFPDLVPPDCLLVTFNGGSFDVPWLCRTFPDWQAPVAHIDLRPVWGRLGQQGGLKLIEERLGLGRPQHLRGLDGSRAAWLWRHGQHGSRQALQTFAEYNLYDAINLRPLAALAYNRLSAECGFPGRRLPVSYRGDVLYDVTKILMSL